MLLRKYMSLIGIGSATVDLRLERETYQPGETVLGTFLVMGGTIEQHVERIECNLILTNLVEQTKKSIGSTSVQVSKQLIAGEKIELPFFFIIPEDTPESNDDITYQFMTKMIFDEGFKSIDQDKITIKKVEE